MYYDLYLLSLLPLFCIILFRYVPMYGVQIAFKSFRVKLGIFGSPWIGFEHFKRFMSSYNFITLLFNTLKISVVMTLVMFPLPIMLALMLNEVRGKWYKKAVQMITYAPHFISTVVVVGMIHIFFSLDTGIVNQVLAAFGKEQANFLIKPEWFLPLYVGSGIWQNLGYSSILFLAVLSSVDVELYEAARIDGASKMQKIMHIDIACLLPTIIIVLILNVGRIMDVGFEKVFLLQNSLNMTVSDVLSTYVYRMGLLQGDYSFSTAVNLFNNVINLILLVTVNQIARRFSETSLW